MGNSHVLEESVMVAEIAIVSRLTEAPEGQMALFMNHLSSMFTTRWSSGTEKSTTELVNVIKSTLYEFKK